MFEHLLKVRYVAIVIVILAVLHGMAFLVLGAKLAIKAYVHILAGDGEQGHPGIELLHSLDFLFVSLVLLVLALGIAKLFLLPPATDESALPVWLRIQSISELKVLLWETVLTTLLIASLPVLVTGLFGQVSWSVMVIPAAVLVLALSLFFMKKA